MATLKNKPVVLSQPDPDTVLITVDGIEGYPLPFSYLRQLLVDEQGLDLLLCRFRDALDTRNITPETATFSQLKTALDGNYKL